jgi:hypothetical protein
MKLKDIVPYCLQIKNSKDELKYYWIINGLNYSIDSLQSYYPDHVYGDTFNCKYHLDVVNFINLSRYCFINPHETKSDYDPEDNYLTLNLNNEITIFDKFILVHKTQNETTEDESKVFHRQNYYIANGHSTSAEYYTIGLFHTTTYCMMVDLRTTIFKDLISPPVRSKPANLTLDEKVDDLVNELMKDSKSMAIKKLKRMLNERL